MLPVLFGIRSGVTVEKPMSTRFLLYVRKSSESEDRQVASLDSQINEMQKLAQKRGLDVVQIFEEAQSAKSPGRPIFNQMLALLYSGQADGIICWKLDRLARNPIDGGNIIWLLTQGKIHQIVTIEGDHSCTDNMIMLYLRFGMAGQFSLDLAKDTKRGLNNKVDKGWMPRPAPPGYVNDRFGLKGEKKIFIDPDQFDKIREIWRSLLTTQASVKDLWLYAKKIGVKGRNGRPIGYGTFFRILHNPFYAGKFCWNLEYHQGSHQPMITWEEFSEAQSILTKRKQARLHTYYKHQFQYRGMIRCGECGAFITGERHVKTNRNGTKVFNYYRCTKRIDPNCSQRAIREQDLQVQMEKILSKRGILVEMQEGLKELRLTNGTVRAINLKFKPFELRSHLDQGLNSFTSFLELVKGVFNGRW